MPETRHVVVMVTTSFPRFPGDSVGTFMEPIAAAVAARGHDVHIVAPWHPLIRRGASEHGVHFHFYKYAPLRSLNVFGYAAAMRADVSVRTAAFVAAPFALAAGCLAARRVARRFGATMMHGHWVVPGGVTAAFAAPQLPLVISLHGSDVFVAERLAPARYAARAAFRRAAIVTACSADLARRAIALGASVERTMVVPYGVDPARFKPDRASRDRWREKLQISPGTLLVATAGRLVRKKGFEFLIDAAAELPEVIVAIAGEGSLGSDLHERAARHGVTGRVLFLGNLAQDEVAALFAAADIVVTPSIRDDAGNVDGLPNVVLEALASGAPLITTSAGGIGPIVEDGRTALVVRERDAAGIAAAVRRLADPTLRQALAAAARELVQERFGWARTAEQLELAYNHALAFKSLRR